MAVNIRYCIIFVISFIVTKTTADNSCLFHLKTTADIVDISELKNASLTAFYGDMVVLFAPCRNTNFTNYSNCTQSTLCLYNSQNKKDAGKVLGTMETVGFEPEKLQMIFKTTDTITTVTLECTPNTKEPILLTKKIEEKAIELLLLSSHACIIHHEPVQPDSSLSNGSVFLILLFVGFTFYFVGGACILYTWKGARGYEMIPNIDFWRGLPLLVRDGFLYLMNGCTLPTVTTTAESYDRI